MKKFNYYVGMIKSSWLLALMVIVAELYTPFKASLGGIFGHHWIGKGIITALTFVLVGYLYKGKTKKMFGLSEADLAWYSTLGSLIVIFVFYLIEFFL